MADFFGGILDSLRGVGDDASAFFDSAIGQALAKGVKGGTGSSKKKKEVSLDDGFYNGNARFSPTEDNTPVAKSADYSRLEVEWLQRMHRFAGLNTGTDVKLGAK